MPEHQQALTAVEIEKRERLKREKPRVHEKILKFGEKIRRGESIAILQFQYDYTCNFSCKHCCIQRFQGKREGRSFTIADVEDLSRQADAMGLAHLVITGGEPLVFPDFDDLVLGHRPAEVLHHLGHQRLVPGRGAGAALEKPRGR